MANVTIYDLTENTAPPAETSWLEIHREGATESERVNLNTVFDRWQWSLFTTGPESIAFTGGVENKLILANIDTIRPYTGFELITTADGPAIQFVGNGNGDTYEFTFSASTSVEAISGASTTEFKVLVRDSDETFAQAVQASGWVSKSTLANNATNVLAKSFKIILTEGQLIDISIKPVTSETLNFFELSASMHDPIKL